MSIDTVQRKRAALEQLLGILLCDDEFQAALTPITYDGRDVEARRSRARELFLELLDLAVDVTVRIRYPEPGEPGLEWLFDAGLCVRPAGRTFELVRSPMRHELELVGAEYRGHELAGAEKTLGTRSSEWWAHFRRNLGHAVGELDRIEPGLRLIVGTTVDGGASSS